MDILSEIVIIFYYLMTFYNPEYAKWIRLVFRLDHTVVVFRDNRIKLFCGPVIHVKRLVRVNRRTSWPGPVFQYRS